MTREVTGRGQKPQNALEDSLRVVNERSDRLFPGPKGGRGHDIRFLPFSFRGCGRREPVALSPGVTPCGGGSSVAHLISVRRSHSVCVAALKRPSAAAFMTALLCLSGLASELLGRTASSERVRASRFQKRERTLRSDRASRNRDGETRMAAGIHDVTRRWIAEWKHPWWPSVVLLVATILLAPMTVTSGEERESLGIKERMELQGPSQWEVPGDYRVIRSSSQLLRAVGEGAAERVDARLGKPRIDFKRFMLVYISAGSQRSSGFHVQIRDVDRVHTEKGDIVRTRWSLAEPTGFVLTVITTPAEIVLVDRAEGEGVFERVDAEKPLAKEAARKSAVSEQAASERLESVAARQTSGEPADWDRLSQEFLELGLPLPPENASLVAILSEMKVVDDLRLGEIPLHRPQYLIGFLFSTGEGQKRMLIGTEAIDLDASQVSSLIPLSDDAKLPGEVESANNWARFPIKVALPTAIQCRHRGYEKMADALVRFDTKGSCGHRESVFYQPPGTTHVEVLQAIAWAHYGNQLVATGTDRSEVSRRMADLLRRAPQLQTPGRAELLGALELTLRPSRAAERTPDRLVDELVDADVLLFDGRPVISEPAALASLIQGGWQSLPTLLEHLDDSRLTRSVADPLDGSPPSIARVGKLVGNVVREFAGDDGLTWKVSSASFVSRDDAQAWWNRVRGEKEEEYLMRAVVPHAPQATRVYDAILTRLSRKYSSRLPNVYAELLARRPDIPTWQVIDAISRADLDQGTKTDVLEKGVVHPLFARRIEAIEMLSQVDIERFKMLLPGVIDQMPPQTTGRYADCPQADLVRLCLKDDRPVAWEALSRSMARAEIGVRMEILHRLGNSDDLAPDRLKRVVTLLGNFLHDRSIRSSMSDPQKYEGCAGHRWRELSVQNWAAYQIALLLKMNVEELTATGQVSSAQWDRFRNAVESRVKQL